MTVPVRISEGGLETPEVAALLRRHLDDMALYSPPESVHALDLGALSTPDITFWSAWSGSDLLGTAALREIDLTHGEIKSMRTDPSHLRRGTAGALLRHVVAEATARGYRRLSLETGSGEAFEPALALYARHGFARCGPFGDYVDDPFSVFMTVSLGSRA